MFKLIFRIIVTAIILIVLSLFLAFWKGGEGFRWIGEKIKSAGKAIEKFGDMVDGIKTLKQLKKEIDTREDKDATTDNRKRDK